MTKFGDQAFRSDQNNQMWKEMTYAGAQSFLRRRYTRNLENVHVAVSGIPYDGAVTFRPGCRFGPQSIRAASVQLAELSSFPFGIELHENLNVVDWGDCYLDPHNPETISDTIFQHAKNILSSKVKLLTFGGDHFVSYPLIKAHAEFHGPVALLQFDAHCDTWPDDGKRLDHGTMFSRGVSEGIIDASSSTQVGLRTVNYDEYGFEILTAPWIHRNGLDATIKTIKDRAGEKPLYISFDVDGLDPAFAPGTGTPVPGGLASWQAFELIRCLGDMNLIGMDIVEVSPPYDNSEITALAAATVAHDWLCLLAIKNGAQKTEIGKV